jgi:hypothetical protein
VGDHCLFVVDFVTALLVGTGCSQQIVRPALCCLNTRIAGCALWYNKALQRNILRHRLLERMVAVATSNQPKAEIAKALNKLDKEGEGYMKHVEKKCCRLKSGRIPFSPEVSLWIRQSQVYRSLLRWHARKIHNCGNLRRTARHCQINAPFQLTVDDIKLRLRICKEKCDYFWKHGKWHQRQHLNQCLERVQEWENEATERQILAIIKREKDQAFWRRLNFALGKHICGQSVRAVQVEDGAGGVIDYDTEETVQQQSSMKCIVNGTISRRKHQFVKAGCGDSSATPRLCRPRRQYWMGHTTSRRTWMRQPGNSLRRSRRSVLSFPRTL